MSILCEKMKKTIFILLLIALVFVIGFYIGTSEPTITGAAVAQPGLSETASEKVVYLEAVNETLTETKQILENVNSYTQLAMDSNITTSYYNELLKQNLERIKELRAQVYSMQVPESYSKHHESLKKEFDYYQAILEKMADNSTIKEIKILN